MSDILLDAQGNPTTPSVGQGIIYFDSLSKQASAKNADGLNFTLHGIKNWNTADVIATGVDTYLAGSALAMPNHLVRAGATFRWRIYMTKSGAGIATPIWTIRVGTLGTVVDTARVTLTGPAQTGVIDTGMVEIDAIIRSVGAAGVLSAGLVLKHNLAATGFANVQMPVLQANSAGFDTTSSGLIFGISVNPGASGVWTHQVIEAEVVNV